MLRPQDIETQQRLDEMNARVKAVTAQNEALQQRLQAQELRAQTTAPRTDSQARAPPLSVQLRTLESIDRIAQRMERDTTDDNTPKRQPFLSSSTGPGGSSGAIGLGAPAITGIPVCDEWLNERVRIERLKKQLLKGAQTAGS
jgi:hypothetical protein